MNFMDRMLCGQRRVRAQPILRRPTPGARVLLAAGVLLGAALPATAVAQARADRNVVRLDASYLAGSLSYARRASDKVFVGGGFGLGVDIVRAPLVPDRLDRDDFSYAELVHLAGFSSFVPSTAFRADAGVRAAVILFGESDFSGFVFVGPYVAPAVGFRRVKVGSRAQIGLVAYNRVRGLGIFVQPIFVSLALPW